MVQILFEEIKVAYDHLLQIFHVRFLEEEVEGAS